jgi:hypothetical protein
MAKGASQVSKGPEGQIPVTAEQLRYEPLRSVETLSQLGLGDALLFQQLVDKLGCGKDEALLFEQLIVGGLPGGSRVSHLVSPDALMYAR